MYVCWGVVESGEGASEGSAFWPCHVWSWGMGPCVCTQLFILAVRLHFRACVLLGRRWAGTRLLGWGCPEQTWSWGGLG